MENVARRQQWSLSPPGNSGRRGNKTVDLLISFQCEQMAIFGGRGRHEISVSSAARRVFNHTLAEYDVPLPEPQL